VLWDIASGTQKTSASVANNQQFLLAAASSNGQTVVTFAQSGILWDGATLQQRATVEGMKMPNWNSLALSADGKRLAAGEFHGGGGVGGGQPGRVRVWDTA